MNYNAENQRDKITAKFLPFCKVNLTEFDIYFTIFQTYFKKKYNLSKFTKKNLKLIQLSRY